jgi:hypothetical protein
MNMHMLARPDGLNHFPDRAVVFRHCIAYGKVAQRDLVPKRDGLIGRSFARLIGGENSSGAMCSRCDIDDRHSDIVARVMYEKVNHSFFPSN